jgi:hypothetical protein
MSRGSSGSHHDDGKLFKSFSVSSRTYGKINDSNESINEGESLSKADTVYEAPDTIL